MIDNINVLWRYAKDSIPVEGIIFCFLKDKEYLYAKECIYVYASKLFIK
ncbi:MAG: hypothetical protein QG673_129 [Pseudomonadota bacterium]|nr:hypothetical protein [Pseudomonadota bacterium]